MGFSIKNHEFWGTHMTMENPTSLTTGLLPSGRRHGGTEDIIKALEKQEPTGHGVERDPLESFR